MRLGRFAPDRRLWVKLEHLQPSGSVWDRVAGPLLEARRGASGPAVVAGSGSLCLAFAAAAARARVPLVPLCPAATLPEHLVLLRRHGLAPVLVEGGLEALASEAEAEAEARGGVVVFSPGEHRRAAASLFAAGLGRELAGLLGRLGPVPEWLVVPVGSGALLEGLTAALAAAGRALAPVAVVRPEGPSRQDGVVARSAAPALTLDVEWAVVPDEAAEETRLALARTEGLLLGLGSAAAVRVARERAGEGGAVVIAVDAGDRYFSVDRALGGLP